jgi:pyruvate kinase
MKRVILYTQENNPLMVTFNDKPDHSRQSAICMSLITLADAIRAKAIVAETRSGATALHVSSRRPRIPVIAVTSDKRVSQQMSIVFGVKSYVRPVDKLAATKLTNWLQENKVLHKGDVVVSASGQYPGVVGSTDTIKVRVLQ